MEGINHMKMEEATREDLHRKIEALLTPYARTSCWRSRNWKKRSAAWRKNFEA